MPDENQIDIWRDTDEPKRRCEWLNLAREMKSVENEMNNWKPRTRNSAKRMKHAINQIRLDVARTWGSHSAFSTDAGKKALERVLVSWVARNPHSIGYCQSMNFVAAVILAVFKGNEDECLTVFSCLMEDTSFGDYFQRECDFEALREDTCKLSDYLRDRDRDLAEHLEDIDFCLASVTPSWLLTCFFLVKGPSRAIDVVDGILKSGRHARKTLIEHALAILLDLRVELLQCRDIDNVFELLKTARFDS